MNSKKVITPIKSLRVSDLLAQTRKEKGLTLAEVSAVTKIRQDALLALEKGDYSLFASEVYLKGFLRNYAKFLGLDIEKVLALYRRERESKPKLLPAPVKQEELKERPHLSQIVLSQKSLTIISLALIAFLFVFYLLNQVNALLSPPLLEITTPVQIKADYQGEIIVAGSSFQLTGKTSPQTIVKLNSVPITLKPGFEFETEAIPLPDEQFSILLTATNQFGRTSTIDLKVKKGSITGEIKPEKITAIIQIENETTALLIRKDGTIEFNDRAYPGDVITVEANKRLQIESETPYNIKLTINGELYPFTAHDQTWELSDGQIIPK